ncbi:MAG: S-adenosylmethionine:tRNA ribosyltransferase-isomerase [Bacteroidota bacterium]|jgi:S-adenosylmethionine:tRNA ribosyltransferase-isomerase
MITKPHNLQIADFDYELPVEKIAVYPLEERDQSRLLQYKNKVISDHFFYDLAAQLPADAWLVFNQTKVIPARIVFEKPTGGQIEVFCLEPIESIGDMHKALSSTKEVSLHCLVGGASKWKKGTVLIQEKNGIKLEAQLREKAQDSFVLDFSWFPANETLATILDVFGQTPLPPYLKRKATGSDSSRYQTVYAKKEGSVAAPTAGLHFTTKVLQQLEERNISTAHVVLHVGAGTFKPVKASILQDHEMHQEWIDASLTFLKTWLDRINQPLIGVGTTTLRTLESLYWLGLKIKLENPSTMPTLQQWEPYQLAVNACTLEESLISLINWMEKRELDRVLTQTALLIAPGYSIKTICALLTNFHQPRSTLLLLIAALVGEDWKKIYAHALENNYRFLSYGDSSLLWKKEGDD